MKYSQLKFISALLLFLSFTSLVNAQTWPCRQYITRQVSNGSGGFITDISYVYSNGGAPTTVPVCTSTLLLNASVYYNGNLWAWKQYSGSAQSGSGGAQLVKLSYNTCAATTFNFASITANPNAAFVDNAGVYYLITTGTSGASNFVLTRFNISSGTPTQLANTLTVNLPSGSTVSSGGLGDFVYYQGTVYVWINQTGLFKFTLPSVTTTSVNATRIWTTADATDYTRTVGSLFLNNNDPGFIYGYGSTSSSTTQDRIVKINATTGDFAEITGAGTAVSQSDGAGCPEASFNDPTLPSISGTVYSDTDALVDNLIDGTGTNGGGLFVNLVRGGVVIGVATVAADGTYSVSNIPQNATYTLILSTTAGTIGSVPPSASLHSGWINTGEGTTAAGDGTVNGTTSVAVVTTNISGVNFGIQQPNAGVDQTICSLSSTVTMAATTTPGTWTAQAGNPGTATITTPTSSSSTITNFALQGLTIFYGLIME